VRDLIVIKFGGTSVGSPEAMSRAARIVLDHAEQHLLVVVSALSGVTDTLVAMADLAARGRLAEAKEAIPTLRARHGRQARALLRPDRLGTVLTDLDRALRALEDDLEERRRDRVLGFGEWCSAKLLTALICQAETAAVHRDAYRFLVIEPGPGVPRCDRNRTRAELATEVLPDLAAGRIVVTQGFVGTTADGQASTLGRGGSDYSATLLAALLEADAVQIRTDVDGVHTADPALIPEATLVPRLNPQEAWELAHHGAEVLYPPCLDPLRTNAIPLHVQTTHPDSRGGTLICSRVPPDERRLFVNLISRGRLLRLTGRGTADLPHTLLGAIGDHLDKVETLSIREREAVLVTGTDPGAFLSATAATTRVLTDQPVGIIHLIGGSPDRRFQLQRACHEVLGRAHIPITLTGSVGRRKHVLFTVPAHRAVEAARLVHNRFCLAAAESRALAEVHP